MITVIDALNEAKFTQVLDEVYQLRSRVFSDRLGWAVDVKDGREFDLYDSLNPAHLVCLDDDGDVVGCMRLLQTTGPNMLADIFSDLLDGEPPLRSTQIWEATRFCIDTEKLKGGKCRNSISHYTSELMVGVFEYAKSAGIADIVAVIDPVMNRVMKRSGNAPYDYIGSTKPMGVVKAMVALMDCTEERITSIREFANINHDVFLDDDTALELFEEGQEAKLRAHSIAAEPMPEIVAPSPKTSDLQQYCYEQFLNAQDDKDAVAAARLLSILAEKIGTDDPAELQRMARSLPQRRQPLAAPSSKSVLPSAQA
ncbi:acyl-homoserine-lactone synthase [Cognatishimia activa]|uniref:Acyl-homoserine-lactone synthase n=1 Tax=Cognatishimia activa TaxID=1715691 RepID=A0A0P1IYM8_9RHOB|nr:acyl-homoserine-lactone synthase [Cognatishimia activa]CUI80689.1 Acyl-homoserine-lactone synthase [Cognatishimia activa]CUK26883.1 Acyl-homoserine-lactone synthase [Cognatishimia activa]